VTSVGLICSAGIGPEGAQGGQPGKVQGFRARNYIEDRKMLKIMTRSVQLGVASIQIALDGVSGWDSIPPSRRGMFVGTTPLGGDAKDLLPALEVSTNPSGELSMQEFASKGYDRIHPLWLIRGLSNNVLGLAAAIHDFQGVNANYCSGDPSGLLALCEGYWAVAEGRADLVVAGAADAMVDFSEQWMGVPGGEGAAFFVLRPQQKQDPWSIRIQSESDDFQSSVDDRKNLGYLGAAGGVVSLARDVFSTGQTSMKLDNGQGLTISR